MKTFVCALMAVAFFMTNISAFQRSRARRPAGDPELARKIARFAPTTLTANTASLSPGDRKALGKIIEAAKLLDPLFLRQVWSGNEALETKLRADTTAAGAERLHYF